MIPQRNLSRVLRKIRHIVLLIFCLLFADNAWSQNTGLNPETLQEKLFLYSKIHPSGLLFVHTDKTLYTLNEPLWFSAYLINNDMDRIGSHTLLSISLMREDNRQVLFEEKHVMEKGLSYGSLIIPDNIPPGNYLLNACTNILDQSGQPVAVFSQPLTIKSTSQRPFDAVLSLLDTVVTNGVVRAKVTIEIKDRKPREKATIEYSIGSGKKLIAVLTENSAVISIPAAQLNEPEPVLLTAVKYNYDTLYLSVKLPKMQSRGLNVRFFPEGGSLSDGLESTIGLESTTVAGLPVALNGILYRNDQSIDTVSTNSYGAGSFRLKPDIRSRYTFKVKANTYLDQDSVYNLPNILESGVVMYLNEAVVKDTVRMILYSKSARRVQVAIHNYREAFSMFSTEANPEGKKISLVIPTLPKGVATISILNEEGKPLAERLFFAHYDHKISAAIKTQKETYNKKDSVQVKISLRDQTGSPVQGLVSIAAVQDNRIEGAKQQDIESYVYLYNDLGALPRDPQGRGFSNKIYLEDMFLIRGWRRYTWQDLMQSKVTDTLSMGPLTEFKGNVYYGSKALKKPLEVIIRRDSLFDPISTSANGSFILNQRQLQITEGKKVFLWVNLPDRNEYNIHIDDPFQKINRQIADQAMIITRGFAQAAQSREPELQGLEKVIALDAVIITGNKKDSFISFGYGKENPCGDYVCQYGRFNCPNHTPFNSKVRPPVKGEPIPGGIYQGCTTNQQSFGIYTAREFYGLNRDPESLSAPQYLSTLFWKPGAIANETGELSFSFFTGDITGKFLIVIQGIAAKDMIFGEGGFTVK